MSADRADDLRVYDEAAAPVRRWLADLDDLLAAMAVAGLAWPDAELGADLVALAERGDALGATEGAGRLRALAEDVDFGAWMALVSWVRRARRELDLVAVQAALVVRGTTESAARKPKGPVVSVQLEPVGAELSGDRLAIHAVSLGDGEAFLLLDQLVEISDADPLGTPVISRLFQRRVRLSQVLGSVIVLDEHPVLARGRTRVVRPAFDRTPVVREVAGRRPLRSGTEAVVIGREGTRAVARDANDELVPLAETAVFRFTATKLAIRCGGLGRVRGRLTHRKAQSVLLSAELDPDGRCFPAIDPRAFPLSPAALTGALADRAEPGALWARAVLLREGAEDADLVPALSASTPSNVDEAWLLGRACRAIGRPVPAICAGFAAPTLGSAEATSDARWQAIWLILASERLEDHGAALHRAWQSFYGKAPSDPVPADLCARSVLMDALQVGGLEEASPSERALGWLDAHLIALRLGARAREPRLPTLRELAWLAETRLLLTGEGGGTPLTILDLPPDRLRLVAIEALWEAFGPERTGSAAHAADAIWALGLAGLRAHLFSPRGSAP